MQTKTPHTTRAALCILVMFFALLIGWWQFGISVDVGEYNDRNLFLIRDAGKWGFIYRNGAIVIPAVWDEVNDFSGGLAPVKKEGKWGYINKKGAVVIGLMYDRANIFKEGLATVQKGTLFGMVNTNGEMVIDCKYGWLGSFCEGLAEAKLET